LKKKEDAVDANNVKKEDEALKSVREIEQKRLTTLFE